MDVVSEILDMIGDIVELVITQFINKKAKRNKQDNKNERSKEKQCITK